MTAQEALDNLIKVSCPRKKSCGDYEINCICNCEAKGYIDVLQKLVDRTTPSKPVLLADGGFDVNVSSHLCCPHCKQSIVNVWSTIKYKPKYCHYCGKALGWSEEDEPQNDE